MNQTRQPYTAAATIEAAKQIIAASSAPGAHRLGAGAFRRCSPARYNLAALAALADPDARMSDEERRLVGSFVTTEDASGTPAFRRVSITIRMTSEERDRLVDLAQRAGTSVSDLVREKALAE